MYTQPVNQNKNYYEDCRLYVLFEVTYKAIYIYVCYNALSSLLWILSFVKP